MAAPAREQLTGREFESLVKVITANSKAFTAALVTGRQAPSGYQLPAYIKQARLMETPPEVVNVLTACLRVPIEGQLNNEGLVAAAVQQRKDGQMDEHTFSLRIGFFMEALQDCVWLNYQDAEQQLKTLGEQHPEWHQIIIQAYNEVTGFIGGHVTGPIGNLFMGLLSDFDSWESQVNSTYEKAQRELTDWWASTFG